MYNLRETAQNFKTAHVCAVYENVGIAPRTTFKIGGVVPLLVEPASVDALIYVLKTVKAQKIPFFVLGGGANVVFPDSGFEGIVIALSELKGIAEIEEDSSRGVDSALVRCKAGTPICDVVDFCMANGLGGFESFAGLPGTVGGAVYMNARCFDREISDVVGAVKYVDCDSFEEKVLEFDKKMWAYKKSPFTGTSFIITEACFYVKSGQDSKKITEECERIVKARTEKGHFKYPCAGSMFKNNRSFGKPSGQLIDEAGLRGYMIGGAQIAPWHGNIIINTGGATQKDVKSLVSYAVEKVKEKTGFILEPEVIFL